MPQPKPLAPVAGADNTATLEQAAQTAKKAVSKKKSDKKGNLVTISNTYTLVPFFYADGRSTTVPMLRRIGKLYGVQEAAQNDFKVSTKGTILGKGIGSFKGKSIKISRGYILKERKTATKGRKTGIGKASISLTKSYSRAWNSIRVPLDATAIDVIFWIKSWTTARKPDVLAMGKQVIVTGLNKSKGQHKAETVSKAELKGS